MRGQTNSIKLNHGQGSMYTHCCTAPPPPTHSQWKARRSTLALVQQRLLPSCPPAGSIVLLSALEYNGEFGSQTGFASISESIVASMGLIVEVSKVVSMVLQNMLPRVQWCVQQVLLVLQVVSVVSPNPPQVDKKRAHYDTWERGLCYVSKEPFRS